MFRSKLSVAATLATLTAAPVGISLAAPRLPTPPPANGLHVPFMGHASAAGQMRDSVRGRLVARHESLARRLGQHRDTADARRLSRWSIPRLRRADAQLRRQVDGGGGAPPAGVPAVLVRIAQCESHGDPHAIGGGGLYRGALQMTTSIWRSVGGTGDPAAAPLAEQYRRAAILYRRSGPGQWPVCGA